MYDREFFTSKLGVAALVSIGAMVTFNIFALTQQTETAAEWLRACGCDYLQGSLTGLAVSRETPETAQRRSG